MDKGKGCSPVGILWGLQDAPVPRRERDSTAGMGAAEGGAREGRSFLGI